MKKSVLLISLLAMALLLSACTAPKPAATPTPVAATEAPAATAVPATEAPAAEASAVPATNAPAAEAPAVVAEYHKMTPQEAKARMDSGDPVIVLDVRTQSEFDSGHIEGALLLSNEQIGTTRPELLPDLNAEILVYCRSGNRSRQAAQKLVAMGYTAVYDFGGIGSWPYEVVK